VFEVVVICTADFRGRGLGASAGFRLIAASPVASGPDSKGGTTSDMRRLRTEIKNPKTFTAVKTLGVFKLAENGTIYGYQNMGVYFSF
jgi:hypothetical protein